MQTALWAAPPVCGIHPWAVQTAYNVGDIVEYKGQLYRAIQSTPPSAPNWDPIRAPNIWEAFQPAEACVSQSGDADAVDPTLDCVAEVASGRLVAVFGYDSHASQPVVVPVGDKNKFSTSPIGRNQPVSFAPGAHHGVFTVPFVAGEIVRWTVGDDSVSASTSNGPVGQSCNVVAGADGLEVALGGRRITLDPRPAYILPNAIVDTQQTSPGWFETVGNVPVGFDVTGDGAATARINIWTPPGRMGMEPSLELAFSSRGDRGLLGVGWDLSGFGISSITRCHTTIAQDGDATPIRFDDDDVFCLDAQRLVPVPGGGGGAVREYRLDRDPFTRVKFDTEAKSFHVSLRDGRVLDYGTSAASRHAGPRVLWGPGESEPIALPSQTVIYAWSLDRAKDAIGNSMQVTYQQFDGMALWLCTELLHPNSIHRRASWRASLAASAIQLTIKTHPSTRAAGTSRVLALRGRGYCTA